MRLPIARLLVKAAKWLAPRIKSEIEDEVLRKTGVDVRREMGMGQGTATSRPPYSGGSGRSIGP